VTPHRLLLAFVVAFIAAGCVGDASHRVDYHNTTSVPLSIYADSTTGTRLVAPGETYRDQWVVPAIWSGARSGPMRHVEAKSESGALVFCHRYTYEELDRLNWVIEIVPKDDCST
jgi:hypothetical protein